MVLVKTILLIITLHILLLANLQFIPWPENLTWPYLNSLGLSYYKDIFVLYPPFYWELLSWFYKFFGLSMQSLQLLSWTFVAVTDFILWIVAKRNWKVVAIYLPLQIFFGGNGLWVDHLLAPFFLLSYHFFQTKKYFFLGLCLGLALLTKQTAVYFIFTLALLLLQKKTSPKQILTTICGLVIPLIGLFIYLISNNQLAYFYNDAIKYILLFHTKHPLQTQLPTLRQSIVVMLLYLPVTFTLLKKRQITLLVLLISASLGVFTRFEYFHLQPALPFLAMALISSVWVLIFYAVFILLFFKFLFSSWHQSPRFFDESTISNAKLMRSYIGNGETLVINTWDQYYWLTDSLPVGRFFVPSTPWTMDYPGNQQRIVANLAKNTPRYIIYNNCFRVKNLCYYPKLLAQYVSNNYLLVSKLPDGTGIFQYNPMSVGKIIEPENSKRKIDETKNKN